MRYTAPLALMLLICILIMLCFAVIIHPWQSAASTRVLPVDTYRVINMYPHDRYAFTEGLAYDDGCLIESTGLLGNSTIRLVNLTTGSVIREHHLPDTVFGEGTTVFGDRIAQATETSGYGFLYSARNLSSRGTFPYSTGGWGMTYDGRSLILSDGSSTLYFLEPETFRREKTVTVTVQGEPLTYINELEYVNGEVYANIWPTYLIARISPETGQVTGWIDLTGILQEEERRQIGWAVLTEIWGDNPVQIIQEACPNGIAYDPAGNRLFVTGKLWPVLYQIELVPA